MVWMQLQFEMIHPTVMWRNIERFEFKYECATYLFGLLLGGTVVRIQ